MRILIVGSGFSGAIIANELKKNKENIIKVIDKNNHIGGLCYDYLKDNYYVQLYGPHIFHTNSKQIWSYLDQFDEMIYKEISPVALSKNNIYNLPFNMNTFSKIFNVIYPEDAKKEIEKDIIKYDNIENLEQQALSTVGSKIYNLLIKEYTEKQWKNDCDKLSPSIIKRLPLRFTYNNSYYNCKYQGYPKHGYTNIIRKMLDGVEIELNKQFDKSLEDNYDVIFFSGGVDDYLNINEKLEYRYTKFEQEIVNKSNYQGVFVMNYCDKKYPFTRITEFKHLYDNYDNNQTVIMKEYPSYDGVKCYPINDDKNNKLYKEMIKKIPSKVILCGRLGLYEYLDIDKVIEKTLNMLENFKIN